ncbi:Hint domain-containing protein [Salinihabitans flavidus]|uniref:Hint domain-containing protein n=2 Tax=Salinihabitans flavidus TaxID=569882 RepID=A0A1H8LN64_9RHOB|nr:Hint domain-containing protein [Salinihabitans flavidus]
MTGNEIGTFSNVSTSGNNNGMKVKLSGVEALGTEQDVFRIVVRQVNDGDSLFSNGQFVDIYAWPETDPPSPPIYSSLNPQHDQFQGRASSGDHQIITSPANIVFDANGLTSGTVQYGPGADPPRDQQLSFETFSPEPMNFPCFAAGTLIETGTGPLPVDVIRPGDLVRTLDNGLQPVRWAGQREVPGLGTMAPVEIKAGALGNWRDLLVSPQHRMLVENGYAELYFGQPQVLVAALHLVNGSTIRQIGMRRVRYVHLVFDRHEVIWAEGIPSESLHLGAMTIETLNRAARAELEALFPEKVQGSDATPTQHTTARRCLRRWESALVA